MIVAGVGFRSIAAADEIVGLVDRALDEAGIERASLGRLATVAALADAPAFRAAAERLGVEALGVGSDTIESVSTHLATRSKRSLAAQGTGSVAEAAALGAAGPGARLVLPRIASAVATCALACGEAQS